MELLATMLRAHRRSGRYNTRRRAAEAATGGRQADDGASHDAPRALSVAVLLSPRPLPRPRSRPLALSRALALSHARALSLPRPAATRWKPVAVYTN